MISMSDKKRRARILEAVLLGCVLIQVFLPSMAYALDLNNGKKLYLAHCAGCHGIDGNSMVPKAPSFSRGERLQQADFSLVNYLKAGSSTHPPFSGLIAEKEMYDVVAFLRVIR